MGTTSFFCDLYTCMFLILIYAKAVDKSCHLLQPYGLSSAVAKLKFPVMTVQNRKSATVSLLCVSFK